ncbi:MAG: TatD family hydrolase [Chloroflexi bacterium]|nr:TatD family hydrolase [Chloroflexota bacterium]
MNLIDSHCHLDDAQFANDLEQVIQRAADAGVRAILTAGTNVASSRAAIALADKYAMVYAAVGIHPQDAQTCNDKTLNDIRALAQEKKVLAIGEIGLDFYWKENAPRAIQEKNFVAHLDLAAELDKPVVIHDRDAHDPVMEILRRRNGKPRGILHCFSGDLAMAREAIELGYFISFGGSVTFQNARGAQEIARALPLEKIAIETDAPYLAPHPERGKRNEPAHVARVAEKIAALKELTPAVVAEKTRANSISLFGFGARA